MDRIFTCAALVAATVWGCRGPMDATSAPDAPERPATVVPPIAVTAPADPEGQLEARSDLERSDLERSDLERSDLERSDLERSDLERFGLTDIFELEWASDPQIAPDGRRVVYLRRFMDKMKDVRRAHLWIVDADGRNHRPLVTDGNVSSPRWSPSGDRIAYSTKVEGRSQLMVRWMDDGQTTAVTRVTEAPTNLSWSPDGQTIAFTMFVPRPPKPLVSLPKKPKGARWAKPPKVIDQLLYRFDGRGYLPAGYQHVFVVPALGGTPLQMTKGDFNHDDRPAWTPDGRSLIISGNRRPDWPYHLNDSSLFEIDVASGRMTQLTVRYGPEDSPSVSPDGRTIAFTGFEDQKLGFQTRRLHVLDRATQKISVLLPKLDRSIRAFEWAPNGRGLYVLYDDHGNTKLVLADRQGGITELTANVGGTSLGRPYASGSFSVARNGAFATTMTRPDHPADVVLGRRPRRGADVRRLTRLNDDLFARKTLGAVETINFKSSADQLPIQAWMVKPPDFDPTKKYPLLLEIHGGPFANYGDRFSAECQLYAAAGYVVLYVNPRGSTSYGASFANEIHHDYPNEDYDDLMSAVDEAIGKGFIDPDRLYVTGGSGGGVLTAWIVGKTTRFRAAVVAKPVINWISFVFTSDLGAYLMEYWFSGRPWEKPDEYIRRSPLFLAGHVKTPTMLLTGESDYRTPLSEAEQLYMALKAQKVDTVMVRIPGASHSIARRPSQLMSKVAYILAWFHKHKPADPADSKTK